VTIHWFFRGSVDDGQSVVLSSSSALREPIAFNNLNYRGSHRLCCFRMVFMPSEPFRAARFWGERRIPLWGLGHAVYKVRAATVKSRIWPVPFFESGQVDGVGNAVDSRFCCDVGRRDVSVLGDLAPFAASISQPPGFHGCEQPSRHTRPLERSKLSVRPGHQND